MPQSELMHHVASIRSYQGTYSHSACPTWHCSECPLWTRDTLVSKCTWLHSSHCISLHSTALAIPSLLSSLWLSSLVYSSLFQSLAGLLLSLPSCPSPWECPRCWPSRWAPLRLETSAHLRSPSTTESTSCQLSCEERHLKACLSTTKDYQSKLAQSSQWCALSLQPNLYRVFPILSNGFHFEHSMTCGCLHRASQSYSNSSQ